MALFGTAGIRGPVSRISPELCLPVGTALGELVVSDGGSTGAAGKPDDLAETVVIARDGRVTGETLAAALAAGVTSAGARVLDAGHLPTPALASVSRGRYGVVLTASHNPPADNGIKLFVDGQEFDSDLERRIEERVDEGPAPAAWDHWDSRENVSVLAGYRDAVVAYAEDFGAAIDCQVAVDCGNGMASLATPQVLARLGADVRALNANVDGHFPARESKPTPESLRTLREFVADGPAALGIGHDGDGDRLVVVDGDGGIVHEDTVLAILAELYTRRSEAADPVVVTTPNASARIDERVRAAGGRVERVHLGALHEGMARVRAGGDTDTVVAFAAEPWKHVHPAFGGWIDAIVSAAVFSRLVAAEGLDSLRDPVQERPYRKVSVACPDDAKSAVMDDLGRRLPETFPEASVSTDYGVRLELSDGSWTLVRPSGTEPVVRIYAESETVDELVEAVREQVRAAIEERTRDL